MLEVCPDCRTAYHWEVPRFGCQCGRHDPSLAPLAEALTAQRAGGARAIWNADRDADQDQAPLARPATGRRDAPEPRSKALPGARWVRPTPRPRSARPLDRLNLDDDTDDLPWQHRSRDLR